MDPKEIYLTDRSRYEAFLTCPRLRYWAYEYKSRGLARKALSVPLTVGIWTHHGLAILLNLTHGTLEAGGPEILTGSHLEFNVKTAVVGALGGYDQEVLDRGFSTDQIGDPTSPMSWVIAEQRALIEANIRLFALVGLQELVEHYEILEVELDDLHMVTDTLGQMYRPDAVLRRKRTGGLVPLEFKTTWEWNESVDEQNKISNQGLAYITPIEAKYKEKIEGYKYIFIVKGSYGKWEGGSPIGVSQGTKWYRNPLIHPYKDPGQEALGVESEYYVENLWACTEPHVMANGRKCPGPTESKSPKHYLDRDRIKRCSIWEEPLGIKGWIEQLSEKQPEVLNAMVARPMNYVRNDLEVRDWQEQFAYIEQDVMGSSAWLAGDEALGKNATEIRSSLNAFFPMNRQNCWQYQSKCPMFDLCHNGADPATLGGGEFEWRRGHHAVERIKFGDAEDTKESEA